jgi:hypothetical protein
MLGFVAGCRMSALLHFDQEFIRSLPQDPFTAILTIVRASRRMLSEGADSLEAGAPQSERLYEIAQETCAIFTSYLQREGFAIVVPQLTRETYELGKKEMADKIQQVRRFLDKLQIDIEGQDHLGRFEQLTRESWALQEEEVRYEFPDEKLTRIRASLDRIRTLVLAASLPPAHAGRLVKRINALQVNLRATTSDLSPFWGFVAEAYLVVRSPAPEVRSIAAAMEDLISIVWSVQAKAFGLSEDLPAPFLSQRT